MQKPRRGRVHCDFHSEIFFILTHVLIQKLSLENRQVYVKEALDTAVKMASVLFMQSTRLMHIFIHFEPSHNHIC